MVSLHAGSLPGSLPDCGLCLGKPASATVYHESLRVVRPVGGGTLGRQVAADAKLIISIYVLASKIWLIWIFQIWCQIDVSCVHVSHCWPPTRAINCESGQMLAYQMCIIAQVCVQVRSRSYTLAHQTVQPLTNEFRSSSVIGYFLCHGHISQKVLPWEPCS